MAGKVLAVQFGKVILRYVPGAETSPEVIAVFGDDLFAGSVGAYAKGISPSGLAVDPDGVGRCVSEVQDPRHSLFPGVLRCGQGLAEFLEALPCFLHGHGTEVEDGNAVLGRDPQAHAGATRDGAAFGPARHGIDRTVQVWPEQDRDVPGV